MGQNVTVNASSVSGFVQTPTGLLAGAPYQPGNLTAKASYSITGTAADQCNLTHRKTYTLSAAATALDLYGGTLLDPLGNACAFRRVRRIRIRNKDQNDGHTVALGYSATTANAWTGLCSNPGQIVVYPSTANSDGWVELTMPNTTGAAVTTSNKLLNLDPGANTITVDVEIDGCDA